MIKPLVDKAAQLVRNQIKEPTHGFNFTHTALIMDVEEVKND